MKRKIPDMVVVITGASSGIGRAAALEFAKRKATVVLTARRQKALEELAGECESLGGRALVLVADVTDENALGEVAKKTYDTFGSIDVWVNNAAVTMFGRFEEVPSRDWKRLLETNLFGYIHGARAAIPFFREQGRGVLINVASIVGKIGTPYTSYYSISKFGIIGLSESLAVELKDVPDIHVATILPGTIDTPFFQHAANFTGRKVRAMEPVYDAKIVAKQIVRIAARPKKTIYSGGSAKTLGRLSSISTSMASGMYASQMEKKHFESTSVDFTEGNLFDPDEEWNTVSGGWQKNHNKRSKIAIPVAMGIAAGFAYMMKRRSGK